MPSSRNKTYQLPRGHLSWSQIDLFERDPIEYSRTYILGEPRFESEAMMYGKQFAEDMAAGVAAPDADIRHKFLVEIGMPRLELPEHRMEAEWSGIKLVGVLDSCAADYRSFREYKTGRAPWTQGRVDTHGQLAFYGALIWLTKGFLPDSVFLDWVRTEIDPVTGDLTAAGDIKTFPRAKLSLLDVAAILKRTTTAAAGIDELVREYKSSIKQ